MKKPVTTEEQDNESASKALTLKARQESCKRIAELFGRLKDNGKAAEKVAVEMVNGAREIGLELQTMADGEQISWDFYQTVRGTLPFSFEEAKGFTAVARRMAKPASSLETARREILPVWQQLSLLQVPTRDRPGVEAPVATFSRFLMSITTIKQTWQKAMQEAPIERRDPTQLQDFLNDTEWVFVERERVKKHLTDLSKGKRR